MVDNKISEDEKWSDSEWLALLEKLIKEGLLSWKEIASLTLGHMNPSQVGTSLASSKGFKQRYGKGSIMPKVMGWFYKQDGKCHDCGSRLELQADHNKPREEFDNPLDADFIENMVLRCRRCNVIRRESHVFGGRTHLTTETALMWILFNFRPRTLIDFVRMCRLYGMTMADVRMQEGWAMAHWLRKIEIDRYVIDTSEKSCQVLVWPDAGITRCWSEDNVTNKSKAQVIHGDALPDQHLIALAVYSDASKAHVYLFRYRIGNLPFSHYFPKHDAETLAISYTPPKRKKKAKLMATQADAGEQGAAAEELTLAHMAEEVAIPPTEKIADLPEGAKINLMPPRGMKILEVKIVDSDANIEITWNQNRKSKSLTITTKGRSKKVCTIPLTNLTDFEFIIN